MATENAARLIDKLAKLRDVYLSQDDQKRITETESALRRNLKKLKLSERAEVQDIVKEATKALMDISWLLANDETLSTEQRLAIFAEKRVHLFWLERLDGTMAQRALEVMEGHVDMLAEPKQR